MIADPANLLLDDRAPEPALLHCWKHHAGFIAGRVAALSRAGEAALALLPPALLTLGASQMDLYAGALDPEAIAAQALVRLAGADLLDPARYRAWLAPEGYRVLELEDGSRWVLRW